MNQELLTAINQLMHFALKGAGLEAMSTVNTVASHIHKALEEVKTQEKTE